MSQSHRNPETIDSKAVKSLVDAHAIQGAVVLGRPGGFAILVKYGTVVRAIAAQRSGRMRLWRNLNTAAAFVRNELEVAQFEVDMVDHDLSAVERKRPDTAERQRHLHEAAEHDTWFRSEVQKTLDGIADGTVRMIDQNEWKIISEKKKADLQRRITMQGR